MTLHLCYGGTFDPFHVGHLAIARAARDELGVPVWLVPAADPPHRAAPGATAAQRLRMLELATAGEPGLHIDRRELRRAQVQALPSYTVDTLRELRAEQGPTAPIAWLLGADSLASLPTWHDWRALLALTHLVVAGRPGSPLGEGLPAELGAALAGRWVDAAADLAQAPAGRILPLRQPLHEESASEVRRRIAAGDPWRALVPAAVADYLAQQGLYRSAPG